ncbi:MAG TPA: DEAD/DEAH box helicase [Methylococcaceae bacterium]|nr:DEAD/DEAH box helicase [Methylococcaceae bacterium]
MILERFHPAVAAWFRETFSAPTDCQSQAWAAIKQDRHTLIAAPTGSGKTLAAFLAAIDDLVHAGTDRGLRDATQVLYISPLKALSNDIQKNLELPLDGINKKLFELGYPNVAIRSQVRTGDTSAVARAAMIRQPPHILVTTPESVYILLTSEGGRRMLKSVGTVIVDEIHAVLGGKRGSHLALSLERLERLTDGRLTRIGLSATQKPIEAVARFLTGGPEDCHIIDTGHMRRLDLAIEVPDSPLEAVLSQQAAKEIYDRMARLIESHKTTLIFVNTRRMAERLARALSERLGEDNITSHHGSLAREQRLSAECRLKEGKLKALVATASLELGIDIGDVELVCQLGTTGSIATFLQRVGRSGHFAGGIPKGRLFPTSRDDLIECLALLDAVRRRELDRLCIPPKPLDVLAQQIVAMVACEDWSEHELFETVRRAYPYRDLKRDEFDDVVKMLAEGFSTRRGLRAAHLHRDGIHRRLRARRGARLTAITCGGAIPDNADYRVILEPAGEFIGTVDEDFAIESMTGDIFQLGNASWRVLRIEAGTLRVEDAHGLPPSIPFWFGEAPGRTRELSLAVSRLRQEIAARVEIIDDTEMPYSTASLSAPAVEKREALTNAGIARTAGWIQDTFNISAEAAEQAVAYIAAAKAALGVMPSFDTVVFERFFDESGGMQFIIHAPFGSRLNRAWGLALRKRFCRSFNFELQAAATENAVILSLSRSHSFPLEEVARYLSSNTVREILVQALLAAPMFNVRWRWNAVCALALRRFQGGKKTPPYLIRMQAEDLVACVFPDQLACFENIVGDRQIPDHPLVHQTIEDCLTEAMDIDRLLEVIRGIERGSIRVVARDLVEPSPLAAEIVNSRVYSFLDGAPLEERRTRAVASRRWLDPSAASDLGQLDQAAIDRVRREAWPEAGDLEELHDALNVTGFIRHPTETAQHWQGLLSALAVQKRATSLMLPSGVLWIAAERWPQFRALYPENPCEPQLHLPPEYANQTWEREDALVEILRARLEALGPVTAARLSADMCLPPAQVEQALLKLETEGFVLRGRFTPNTTAVEWCERRLLARIHSYTINRLRREIEPVASADFMRFLFRWQRVHPGSKGEGPDSMAVVLEQLEGFETAAVAWESDLLPARIRDYDPTWLDALCLSGKYVWCRLTSAQTALAPVKSSPIALLQRKRASAWRTVQPSARDGVDISAPARRVVQTLKVHGASFFEELVESSGLLKTQVEIALAELVAKGLANSDSFKGLRALLVPEEKKRRFRGINPFGLEEAGRWTLIAPPERPGAETEQAAVEHIAGVLLRRYGVVFRALLTRETTAPPWQSLLRVFRSMEARGEIRGGRFVAGHYGEQFALPGAVEGLRAIRKQPDEDEICAISAADPLNLVGVVTPGAKLPALPGNRILYKAGVPVAVLSGKETRLVGDIGEASEWEIKNQLIRRQVPPRLRAYL